MCGCVGRWIHSLGVGDIEEVDCLRLELGEGGQGERDVLHLHQIPILNTQLIHHLHRGRGW